MTWCTIWAWGDLLDTYDTLRAARALAASGLQPSAVRIDSGDLGALSRDVRRILDEGGHTRTRIFATGELDESSIAQLVRAASPSTRSASAQH